MADGNFRSDRGRDPLAELARLIGQADPYAESGQRQSRGSERSDAPLAGVDWAAEQSYGARNDDADGRYPEPPQPAAASRPSPARPQRSYGQEPGYEQERAYEQDRRHEQEPRYEQERGYDQEQSYEQEQGYEEEQGYENEPPSAGDHYFSGPAARFVGFRDEPDPRAYEEPQQLPPVRQGHQGYAAPDHDYETDEPQQGDEGYAADDYDDQAPGPRRRRGLVVVMAIFGLAVVGTAGAFGYRAMFGGSFLPTLPPIIKASNGPNRVAPAYGGSQADNGNDAQQIGGVTTGSTENLVSREEQPVTIEPPKAAPRIVSTIPVITNQGGGQGLPLGVGAPAAPGPAVAGQAGPGHVASAADPAWPPPPQIAAPASTPVAAPAPPPPQASAEPRKIHTVTIHTDQSGGADAEASPAAAAPAVARPQSRSAMSRANGSGQNGPQNGPMSIVPGQSGAPAPQHTRTAAVASNGSVAAAAPASGGYTVQVTSRRSEEEAQTAFRTLQAKYPDQLGGREPIIRRADLGEKGTYYRALVGPFASAEQAAGLCSGLKAAGGDCIVQRN